MKPPAVGYVYESSRPRSRVADPRKKRWRWEVIAEQADGELWELARIGGNRTRRGNLLRTTAELMDPKKWKLVEVPAATPKQQAELFSVVHSDPEMAKSASLRRATMPAHYFVQRERHDRGEGCGYRAGVGGITCDRPFGDPIHLSAGTAP